MSRYIGGYYHYDGSTTLTLNSTNITHHKATTEAAYNYATVKNSSGQTKYIHTVYISKETVRKIGSQTIHYGWHWHPIKQGYVYNSQGTPLQWWDRPSGIPNLLNVAVLKAQPHTLAVATVGSSIYQKALISIITPTGLEDMVTPLAIHIAGFGNYNWGKIVIIGIDSSNRVAAYDCNNTDYRFDKIWTNDEIYNTQPINSFVTSNWNYGSETYSSPGNVNYYWRYTSVSFTVPNRDNGTTKVVQYIYDADVDTYYWNVSQYDKSSYLWDISSCNNFTGTGGVLQNVFRWQPSANPTIGANPLYQNKTLGGAQFYVNRFLGSINDLFISCTYTPSGGSTTGYTFVSKDQGATWTQKYYGDNCYRICKRTNLGTYLAVGYSNSNYYRSLMMPSDTNWYSSKITFPTTTNFSYRIEIPGDCFILKNSSTVYTVNYENIHTGTDQTVGTTVLNDPDGNPFSISDACWNAMRCEGNMAFRRSHTFYISSNTDSGTLMSETYVPENNAFYKEIITLGGPVLVMTNNG
ncbi:hypothetical protein J6W34_00080 [bacterium]|nr:hypothetical protein [bacterium]